MRISGLSLVVIYLAEATVGSAERWGIFPPRTTWLPVCVAFASVIFNFQVELFSTFASPADGCVIAYGGEEYAGRGTGIRASRCQSLFFKDLSHYIEGCIVHDIAIP